MLGKIGLVIVGLLVLALGVGVLSPYDSKGTGRLQNQADLAKASSQDASGPPNVMDASKWVPTFDDTFSGDTLDPAKWVTCYDTFVLGDNGCSNTSNNEQEWYMPSQVTVANGYATLTAVKQPVLAIGKGGATTFLYRSGMISTGRPNAAGTVRWSATYGYFEARIKYDGGQGVWPAFWLLPANKSWPPEIDIMEHLGSHPEQLLLTSHWQSPQGPQRNGSTITGPDFTKGWHTYAVNWQPQRIDWYVDGKLKKTVVGSTVPESPMEMIINLAIGGNLPGNADARTPFPRTLQVDDVKVYERKQ